MGTWSSKEQTIGTEPCYLKWYELLCFFFFSFPVSSFTTTRTRTGEELEGRYMMEGGRVMYIVSSFVYSLCARVVHSDQRCVETGGPCWTLQMGMQTGFPPLVRESLCVDNPPQANGHLKRGGHFSVPLLLPFLSCLSTCPLSRKSRNTSLYNRKDELAALIRLFLEGVVSDM